MLYGWKGIRGIFHAIHQYEKANNKCMNIRSLTFLCFLTFSIVFPKTALFINLKKSFSIFFTFCLSLLLLLSIYGLAKLFD